MYWSVSRARSLALSAPTNSSSLALPKRHDTAIPQVDVHRTHVLCWNVSYFTGDYRLGNGIGKATQHMGMGDMRTVLGWAGLALRYTRISRILSLTRIETPPALKEGKGCEVPTLWTAMQCHGLAPVPIQEQNSNPHSLTAAGGEVVRKVPRGGIKSIDPIDPIRSNSNNCVPQFLAYSQYILEYHPGFRQTLHFALYLASHSLAHHPPPLIGPSESG
ncbi:hypothetical protein DL95DRAFT_408112 [Leptodontidium sp. 2 PMI_412]|nr:hypothetical protein DL95DRAFT_408112 [Leptodontidium sp. 2 PMI_412]